MSPTRTIEDTSLFDEVKKLSVLKSAWDHVRSRAIRSNDRQTKQERAEIDSDVLGQLRAIQRDLSARRFRFESQKGVLKWKKASKPRPIIVSPLRNRIVQRAILDVCQTDRRRLQQRLGRLPAALNTPTSVGGLPERGVGRAITLIKEAISDGATYFVRSDLKSFFANIPKPRLFEFLEREVSDREFVELFRAALDVDLANADDATIRQWWELFPTEDVGVPQGSALSAISANIILSDFDRLMNSGGITTIRYLDDFLILGRSEGDVADAWEIACGLLADLGLTAHEPGSSEKAAAGTISDGLEFLSFRVVGSAISPTRRAKTDLLADIEATVRSAKRAIKAKAGDPRRAERMFIQHMELIDRKIRGWGDSFKATTQRVEFTQLDQQLDLRIDRFISWFFLTQRTNSAAIRRRMWGIGLLADTPRA